MKTYPPFAAVRWLSALRTLILFVTLGASAFVSAQANRMVEFYHPGLDYYFMTSKVAEQNALDALKPWVRTGQSFEVASTASAGSVSLTRYFFPLVAQNGTRGSHFFTTSAEEVALLNNLNPNNQSLPAKPFNEGVDSFLRAPTGSGTAATCPTGSFPIYRLFRSDSVRRDDANHRYTSLVSLRQNFSARQSWSNEGIALCSTSVSAVGDAAAVGTYAGTFSGGDSGSWRAVITSAGLIRGTAISNITGGIFAGAGTISGNGGVSLNLRGGTDTGATFTGQLNSATGALSGTWSNTFTGQTGAFSGSRNGTAGSAEAWANSYVATYSGLDTGRISFSIDGDGSVVASINSNTYGNDIPGIGVADSSGRVYLVVASPPVNIEMQINANGSITGTFTVGNTPGGTITGGRR